MPALPLIEPARTEELAPAFRLVFRHLSAREREARVANALRLAEQGELDRRGVLVARGPDQLLGCIVCLPVPGASGLVWPPASATGDPDLEDLLTGRAVAWLRRSGAKLAQCLLSPEEAHLAAPLLRHGFVHVTSLWYLRRDLADPLPPARREPLLTCESYDRCDHDRFHAVLLRTYEGTQDCPEVSGVRTIEETIEGHRAQGVHDPSRWWLAWLDGQPAGVLLLAETPDLDAWDVAYVGVVPELRGRGVGQALMRKAIFEAQMSEAGQMTLSVDARNQPAAALYRSLGFQEFDRREVFLAGWK